MQYLKSILNGETCGLNLSQTRKFQKMKKVKQKRSIKIHWITWVLKRMSERNDTSYENRTKKRHLQLFSGLQHLLYCILQCYLLIQHFKQHSSMLTIWNNIDYNIALIRPKVSVSSQPNNNTLNKATMSIEVLNRTDWD